MRVRNWSSVGGDTVSVVADEVAAESALGGEPSE